MPRITKTERFAVVLTKKELNGWKHCATSSGLAVSEWVRRACGAAIVAFRKDLKKKGKQKADYPAWLVEWI